MNIHGGELRKCNKTVTLTIKQIPSHNHAQNINGNGSDGWNNKYGPAITRPEDGGSGQSGYSYGIAGSNWNAKANRIKTDNSGGSESHNNMQPYVTCYFWRRTS